MNYTVGKNRIIATIAGVGAILFAVHNEYQPLLGYIFLPAIGMILLLTSIAFYLINSKGRLDLGEKKIWIPLLVIALSIGISGFTNGGMVEGFALLVFGLALFSLYGIARVEGESFAKPFIWIVITGALGVVVWNITTPGLKSGGWVISPSNYDIIVGVLVLGTVISAVKKQWWLSAIAVTGLFLSGSEEGVFVLAVMFIVVLIRHDWSKKLALPVVTLVILIAICTPLGITQKLYSPTIERLATAKEIIEPTPIAPVLAKVIPKDFTEKLETIEPDSISRDSQVKANSNTDELLTVATGYRWAETWTISPIKPFGHGYILFEYYIGIPHNIVLIIIEQVGILALVAWLWVIGYSLFRGGRKYVLIAILALGVLDHFIWTQIAPWWWATVGIATSYKSKDYIFKEAQNETEGYKNIQW